MKWKYSQTLIRGKGKMIYMELGKGDPKYT